MRIKTALWGLLLAAWTTTAQAAIVYLTDGSRVEGTIVGATARDVQVHTAEGTLTISADRIARIDYQGAAAPPEAPRRIQRASPAYEPAPAHSRFARHAAEDWQASPDEFSLAVGITGPLNDVKLGAGTASNGDVGVLIGAQYLHYTSPRMALGASLELMNRGRTDSPGPVPNADTSVYGGSVVLLGLLKYDLIGHGDARPYVMVGAGAHRTSETVDARPNDGFAWSDTQSNERRLLVDGSAWGVAGTARLGVDFHIFNPSMFSVEFGWTALSGANYPATAAGQALGIGGISGPIHVLTIAGRWGWRF